MQHSKNRIVGLQVNAVEQVHDYLQIRFDKCCQLSIYSEPFISADSTDSLVGKIVVAFDQTESDCALVFSDQRTLRFGIAEADLKGPEAAYFSDTSGAIVWP
jgi:hypothetical protein